jgi:hypothetical protein
MISMRYNVEKTGGDNRLIDISINNVEKGTNSQNGQEYFCAVKIDEDRPSKIIGDTPISSLQNALFFIEAYMTGRTQKGDVFTIIL